MTFLTRLIRLCATSVVMQSKFALTSPPRTLLFIEKGSYTHAVVRTRFIDESGRKACLDSRLMTRGAAVKLAKRIAKDGTEVEVIGFRNNCLRPPPWDVRRAKRLDAVRLNRVATLVSAESMFSDAIVTMDSEETEPDASTPISHT
jgi:hypothetical protein